MVKIAPSILSADFANLGSEIKRLEESGADLIHIDVMDGHFVPNITFGQSIVKALRPYSSLEFDVHLMISNPELYIEKFVQNGANLITVHQEACLHLDRVINQIKNSGIKAGVALNPSTPLNNIEYILNEVDLVLIMSVNPGFGAQKINPNALEKIRKLREMIDTKGLGTQIEVDGGVTIENAEEIVNAGADIIVAGSAVFGANDMGQAIKALKIH